MKNETKPIKYITEQETAARLGISIRTLQLWRLKGTGLKFHRLGGKLVRYSEVELDRWMTENEKTSTSELKK